MQALFKTVICTDGNEGTSSCKNCSRIHFDLNGYVSVLGGTSWFSSRRCSGSSAVVTVADLRTDPQPGDLSYQSVGESLWDGSWEVGAGKCCPTGRLLSAPLQQGGGMPRRQQQWARRGDGCSWWIQANERLFSQATSMVQWTVIHGKNCPMEKFCSELSCRGG